MPPTNKPTIDLPATRAAAEHALARAEAGKPLPVGQARTLVTSALALADHASRLKRGRDPKPSTTIDGRLIAQACAALGTNGKPITRGELATKMGISRISQVILSPDRLKKWPLSEERRALLRRWIAGDVNAQVSP